MSRATTAVPWRRPRTGEAPPARIVRVVQRVVQYRAQPVGVVVETTGGYRVQCGGRSWPCRPGQRATDPPGSWVTPQGVIWVPDPAKGCAIRPAQ
jgi:hypothetical protein